MVEFAGIHVPGTKPREKTIAQQVHDEIGETCSLVPSLTIKQRFWGFIISLALAGSMFGLAAVSDRRRSVSTRVPLTQLCALCLCLVLDCAHILSRPQHWEFCAVLHDW
eukprot:SAG11_NODE_5463_length_1552_cov_1.240881_2_plen_109_part_00